MELLENCVNCGLKGGEKKFSEVIIQEANLQCSLKNARILTENNKAKYSRFGVDLTGKGVSVELVHVSGVPGHPVGLHALRVELPEIFFIFQGKIKGVAVHFAFSEEMLTEAGYSAEALEMVV